MGKVNINPPKGNMSGHTLKHMVAAIGFVTFFASVLRPHLLRSGRKRMRLLRYTTLMHHKVMRTVRRRLMPSAIRLRARLRMRHVKHRAEEGRHG
jgi:hypothetical protein